MTNYYLAIANLFSIWYKTLFWKKLRATFQFTSIVEIWFVSIHRCVFHGPVNYCPRRKLARIWFLLRLKWVSEEDLRLQAFQEKKTIFRVYKTVKNETRGYWNNEVFEKNL